LGNFFTIKDVLKIYDPETVRFFILRSHYRSPLNYSNIHLDDAKAALRRLYTALDSISSAVTQNQSQHESQSQPIQAKTLELDWTHPFALRFKAAMDEDFATPEAVSVLFDLAGELNRSKDPSLAYLLKGLGSILGILSREPSDFLQSDTGSLAGGLTPGEIQQQIDARATAKKNKDFALADKIRADLTAQGIVLKDSAQGTQWERA
jgi:cysteinyl-tRNA synthetase